MSCRFSIIYHGVHLTAIFLLMALELNVFCLVHVVNVFNCRLLPLTILIVLGFYDTYIVLLVINIRRSGFLTLNLALFIVNSVHRSRVRNF